MEPTTMALMQLLGGGGGSSAGGIGMPVGGSLPIGTGYVGAYNLITGIKQKRAADRMAYRSAEQGMGYVQEAMAEGKREKAMGLSSQQKALMRQNIAQGSAQAYTKIAESTPGAASFFSRVAGMDRIKGAQMMGQEDVRAKLQADAKISGARSQATNIIQRSIQDERADKRMAQQAAGQAIASGIGQLGTFMNYAAGFKDSNDSSAGSKQTDSAGNSYYLSKDKYEPGTAGMTDLGNPDTYANMG